MTENVPNLVRERVTHVQEAQRISDKRNPKRPTPRHTLNKWEILKTKREY